MAGPGKVREKLGVLGAASSGEALPGSLSADPLPPQAGGGGAPFPHTSSRLDCAGCPHSGRDSAEGSWVGPRSYSPNEHFRAQRSLGLRMGLHADPSPRGSLMTARASSEQLLLLSPAHRPLVLRDGQRRAWRPPFRAAVRLLLGWGPAALHGLKMSPAGLRLHGALPGTVPDPSCLREQARGELRGSAPTGRRADCTVPRVSSYLMIVTTWRWAPPAASFGGRARARGVKGRAPLIRGGAGNEPTPNQTSVSVPALQRQPQLCLEGLQVAPCSGPQGLPASFQGLSAQARVLAHRPCDSVPAGLGPQVPPFAPLIPWCRVPQTREGHFGHWDFSPDTQLP